jgi:hypothetical protein
VTYVLEPLVAGELGDATQLDATTHPPLVRHVEFVLDLPTDEAVQAPLIRLLA